jgi:hypothetical protein
LRCGGSRRGRVALQRDGVRLVTRPGSAVESSVVRCLFGPPSQVRHRVRRCPSGRDHLGPLLAPYRLFELQEIKQRADVMSELSRVAHRAVALDHVVVPPTDAGPLEKTGLGEVGHDALNGTLCDPDVPGDVPKADVGILSDAQQDLGVVSEKRPTVLGVT